MIRRGRLSTLIVILSLLMGSTLSFAGPSSLDGTMWMYEHESGARHYIAFYADYHYLNSTGFGQDAPDDLWLKSTSPCHFHRNPDGSILYSAMHLASAAWSLNWGVCNISDEEASFNALGMFYNFFIYNRNEPYVLIATDWSPPQTYTAGEYATPAPLGMIFPSIFGSGF